MLTLKGLVQKVVERVDWQAAIAADGMTVEVVPVQEITKGARQAAEYGLPVASCPFPTGSERARRWHIAYHGRMLELLEEVEQYG